MTLVFGSMVFFVIWWTVLFMVLPFGVHIDDKPQKGLAASAPTNPNLKKKFIATTILTVVIWSVIQVVMTNHWVSFS
jgi:predicted secreted protein